MTPEEMEGHINDLYQQILDIVENGLKVVAIGKRKDAEFTALYSMVAEMALRAGISSQDFLEHFKTRRAYFHASLLQKIEDRNPQAAAELDTRSIDDISTDKYPPLFP